MKTTSIRWRLPISYAGIAVLTALVLGTIMVLTLTNFYTEQERGYLNNSVNLMGPNISKILESGSDTSSLNLYIENLSFLIQARIQLLDEEDRIIADSGSLQTQQFIYTNLSPTGMSAEVLREGKADRYFFNIGINILQDISEASENISNPVFLSQLPTENTLCGFGLGSEDTKSLRHSDQSVSYTLITSDGQPLGKIIISESLAFGDKIITNVIRVWVYASLIAIIVAVSVGWGISRNIVSPLEELTLATQKMTSGQLSVRSKLTSKDEFGNLSRSFNLMADRVEDMIATLRSFVADAAHELHTPISTLRLNLELAADDQDNLDEYLPTAQTQVTRMQSIVDNLLDLSRLEASPEAQSTFSLSELIRDCSEKYSQLAQKNGVSFNLSTPENEIILDGDSAQILRTIENILDNALKFTLADGSINLKLGTSTDRAIITVQDSGIGIPQDDLPNLFQRFHRGRNAVQYPGSGLGLAIVKAIIDLHQGDIKVSSTENGTTITISLPLQSASSERL